MWDPGLYQRYGDERSRPFFDLIAQIRADKPRAVVDLGCGPGELTAALAARWPSASITGVDSSPEMIAKASSSSAAVRFVQGDVRDWVPSDEVDVLVTNATLQWVPGHQDLLRRWVRELPSGAWIAMQVPGNFDAPSHRALRELAAGTPAAAVLREAPVEDPSGYAEILAAAGAASIDAWETTYLHRLPAASAGPAAPGPAAPAGPAPLGGGSPSAEAAASPTPALGGSQTSGRVRHSGEPDPQVDHPVLRWMEGTALRPVRATLDDAAWQDFRQALAARLAMEYPIRDGRVAFPFRRVFVVAQTP